MRFVRFGLLASCFTCCAHRAEHTDVTAPEPRLPLELVADAPLPGGAVRFDYQDLDAERGLLVIAHMNDGSVVITDLDGAVKAEIPDVPVARGVAVASDIGRAFVTASPGLVVEIDLDTLAEVGRFDVGSGPDGIAWDPTDRVVGVSDQSDGALSLVPDAGHGERVDVPLGNETGNVQYDAGRGWFWITVVGGGADRLVAVNPTSGDVEQQVEIPGCDGAHGLRFHPDGRSAFVACEGNDVLARVPLEGGGDVVVADTGAGPDVLSIDPGLGWIYVAAESGDLTVFDIAQDGLVRIDAETPAASAHSVQVDPATHRVYFPLTSGEDSGPVLRIMRPGSGG
jgi:DNA-binding beta-propeller fold protein YncE